MVTPPVVLAAYAASSIAGSRFLESSVAAFRFALVGFVLPFLFVYRPALLMLDAAGGLASPVPVIIAVAISVVGLMPMTASLAGRWRGPLASWTRALLFGLALVILFPGPAAWDLGAGLYVTNGVGILVAAILLFRPGRAAA